jgi:hypothetical protein
MDYCKYHPLQAAHYSCPKCDTSTCKECVDEGKHGTDALCLLCNFPTDKTAATVDIEPFWRRIDKSFRYPVSGPLIAFIVVVSLLSALSTFLPMPLMVGLNILLTGVMVKYCFNCLSETALGNMQAPDISSAYQGGVILIFRLFIMMVIASFAIGFIYVRVSPAFGGFLGVFMIFAFPVIIIIYAMTESIVESLNPINWALLIKTIGLPYGLILALLMVMFGSVNLLSSLIGYELNVISLTAQSLVSNFYSVVMFHLMGYMIFQYQDRLGFIAQEHTLGPVEVRSLKDRDMARIRSALLEGYWGQADDLFRKALKNYPSDDELLERYFSFVMATVAGKERQHEQWLAQTKGELERENPTDYTASIADRYLLYLMQKKETQKLRVVYKLILVVIPAYQTKAAEVRHELARQYLQFDNFPMVIKLINGLHKTNPHYFRLVDAYQLMLEAMQHLPKMKPRIPQCQQLVEQLKLKEQQRVKKKVQVEKVIEPELKKSVAEVVEGDEVSNDLSPIEFK